MKKVASAYGLALLLVFVAACSMRTSYAKPAGSAQGTEAYFDRTLNVSGMVDLDVSTGSGSIEIRQGSSSRVEVHAKIRASHDQRFSDRTTEDAIRRLESNPPIEQSGQTIRIGRIQDRDLERNVSVSYEIVTPAECNVRAHTGSGSLRVDGISGRIETGTGSGSIALRNIKGDLQASTGSGAIHATGVRGGLRMHTGSGGIEAVGEQTAEWELQSGSGGIDIRLPQNAPFTLAAHIQGRAV